MKRIFALCLVGILLLPSLFACGTEPQATETAPVTTPAEPEVPAIEIGESGSSVKDIQLEITDSVWTEENASFDLYINDQSEQTIYYRNQFILSRFVNGNWEIFRNYNDNKTQNEALRYCAVLSNQLHHVLAVTDIFDRFENGTWRISVQFSVHDDKELTEEAWVDFELFGMPPKTEANRSKDVSYSAEYIDGIFREESSPVINVIHSVKDLDEMLEHAETRSEAFDRYDEAYFKDRILVMINLRVGSCDIRHIVNFIRIDSKENFFIGVESASGELLSDMRAYRSILIEPEAGVKVNSIEDVTLYLNGHKI